MNKFIKHIFSLMLFCFVLSFADAQVTRIENQPTTNFSDSSLVPVGDYVNGKYRTRKATLDSLKDYFNIWKTQYGNADEDSSVVLHGVKITDDSMVVSNSTYLDESFINTINTRGFVMGNSNDLLNNDFLDIDPSILDQDSDAWMVQNDKPYNSLRQVWAKNNVIRQIRLQATGRDMKYQFVDGNIVSRDACFFAKDPVSLGRINTWVNRDFAMWNYNDTLQGWENSLSVELTANRNTSTGGKTGYIDFCVRADNTTYPPHQPELIMRVGHEDIEAKKIINAESGINISDFATLEILTEYPSSPENGMVICRQDGALQRIEAYLNGVWVTLASN